MKITHLVTLLMCFALTLSLPLFVNHRPVTSPATARASTGAGSTTPDHIVQSTTTARAMTSSTQGNNVETTIATEVTSSTAADVTTHSTKTAEASSTPVGTTDSDSARETSVSGTTARTSAGTTVTHNRLRRTIPETTTTAPSTSTTRVTPASTVTSRKTPASTTTSQETPASTVTSSPTPSARRRPTRDPRCTVSASDFGLHSIDQAPDYKSEGAPVEDRALCKFEYTANIDRLRHPEMMPEAECPARRCGHCGGDGRCEPVYHNFKVLRRCADEDEAGDYLYRYDYERLAVACVCATPALSAGKPVVPVKPDSDDQGPAPVLD